MAGKHNIRAARRKGVHEEVKECSIKRVRRKPEKNTVIKLTGEKILEWPIVLHVIKRSESLRPKNSPLDMGTESSLKEIVGTQQ